MHSCGIFEIMDIGSYTVCSVCGKQSPIILDPQQGTLNGPDSTLFITYYSRVNRFLKIFDNVVQPHATPKDTLMLQYLKKKTIPDIDTLREYVQKSGLADKRYNSVHLLAMLNCLDYKPTQFPEHLFEYKKVLQRQFLDLEFAHRNSSYVHFFNYNWLLHTLLSMNPMYANYLTYIKQIKCPKRRLKYKEMHQALRTIIQLKQFGMISQGMLHESLNPGMVCRSFAAQQLHHVRK